MAGAEDIGSINLVEEDDDMEDDVGMDNSSERRYDDNENGFPI